MRRSRPDTALASEVDEQLARAGQLDSLRSCQGNWIRTTRHALGWALDDLGEKLSVSKQALLRLEERESAGTISIRKLEELANAMNCHFVYAFIPKEPLASSAMDLDRRQAEARRRHRAMPRPR